MGSLVPPRSILLRPADPDETRGRAIYRSVADGEVRRLIAMARAKRLKAANE